MVAIFKDGRHIPLPKSFSVCLDANLIDLDDLSVDFHVIVHAKTE